MKVLLIISFLISTFAYDRNGAVKYANDYARTPNHKCGNYQKCTPCSYWGGEACGYASQGGDCANFVSQCMHAGGQGFDGCGSRDNKGMLPGVAGLKSCLSSKGWKSYRSKPNNFRAGYPIFLKSGSHAMLATGVSGGNIIFCAHTNDRCDASISAGSVDFYSL